MTDFELEMNGCRLIKEGKFAGAWEVPEILPVYLNEESIGRNYVYDPDGENMICWSVQDSNVMGLHRLINENTFEGFIKWSEVNGYKAGDPRIYKDYVCIGCQDDALKVIERFPNLVPQYEAEEDEPVPPHILRAYEKWLTEQPAEAVISLDGEMMNTNKEITAANINEFENKGYMDSDSRNSRSIRNEGLGNSGEEKEEKKSKGFWRG